MFKNILFISSLFFSFIYGNNIENCNKIGSMQNNLNNSPLYSMGLYVCLELPENNLKSKIISKNNKKEQVKFLSNFTKSNSENITDFKKNFTFDAPHSNITDINIISPSPFTFTNNPSPSISPSISPSSLHNNEKNDDTIDGLLISVITISSVIVVFLIVLLIYMSYKHNYCKNKIKYICDNKTTPDKTTDKTTDKKNDEIKHEPDIENGEILTRRKSFQNIKTKNKNKKPKFTIHKKIINVQENPNNRKSPRMIIKEKPKTLNTEVPNKSKLMILTP